MQITDVRVRKVAKEGKMKAVVSITLDNEFVVHDIKAADGQYRDIAHPINSDTREKIQSIILEKYETALAENEETLQNEKIDLFWWNNNTCRDI